MVPQPPSADRLLQVIAATELRTALQADDALSDGVADEVGAVLRVELRHDVRLVRLDRLDADEELAADALVRVALGDQLQYFALAARQQVVAGLRLRLLRLPEVVLHGVAVADR